MDVKRHELESYEFAGSLVKFDITSTQHAY